MENRYASPTTDKQPRRRSTWVRQVQVVAALLLIQGTLECGMGFILIYQWETSALAVTIILLVFILGGLKCVAGVNNSRYRHRTLGLVALASAPLSLFTIFCVPSAMVVLVYGLVVYLNRDVKHAFLE